MVLLFFPAKRSICPPGNKIHLLDIHLLEKTFSVPFNNVYLECHVLKKMGNTIILFSLKTAACINPQTNLETLIKMLLINTYHSVFSLSNSLVINIKSIASHYVVYDVHMFIHMSICSYIYNYMFIHIQLYRLHDVHMFIHIQLYRLQVILFLKFICFQTRSICLNLDQFGVVKKHRSQAKIHWLLF